MKSKFAEFYLNEIREELEALSADNSAVKRSKIYANMFEG